MVANLSTVINSPTKFEDENNRTKYSLSSTLTSTLNSNQTTQTIRSLSSSTLSNVNNYNLQYKHLQETGTLRETSKSTDLPKIEEHIEIITDKYHEEFGQSKLGKPMQSSTQLLNFLKDTYHLSPDEYFHKNFDNKSFNLTDTLYNPECFYNPSSYSSSFMNLDKNSPNYFESPPDQPVYFKKIKPFEENKKQLRKTLTTLKNLTKYNNVSLVKKKKEKIENNDQLLPNDDTKKENSEQENNEVEREDESKFHSPIKYSYINKINSPTYYITDPSNSTTSSPINSSNSPPKFSSDSSNTSDDHEIVETEEQKIQKAKNSYEELGMTFNQDNYVLYQHFLNHPPSSTSSSYNSPISSHLIPTVDNPLGYDFFSSPYKTISSGNSKNMNTVKNEKNSSRPSTPGYILLNNTASLSSTPQVTPNSISRIGSRPVSTSSRPSSSSGFQTLNIPQSSLKISLDGVPILTSNYSTNIEKLNELNIAKNYGEDSLLNLFASSEVPLVAQTQQTVPFSKLENIIKKATRNGLNGKIVDDIGGWGGIGTLIDEDIEERRKKKQWNMKLREKKHKIENTDFDQSLNDSNLSFNTIRSTNLNNDKDMENDSDNGDENQQMDDEMSLPTVYHSETGDSEVWSNPSYSISASSQLSPIASPRLSPSPLPLVSNRLLLSPTNRVSPIPFSSPKSYKLKFQNDILNSNNFIPETQDENYDANKNEEEIEVKNEKVNGILPKLDINRNLNDEFDQLKDINKEKINNEKTTSKNLNECNDDYNSEEEEDVYDDQQSNNTILFQYEKDFNLFPTHSNTIKSQSARPYKSSNIFQESYQFNTEQLKEVLQSPFLPPSSSSIFHTKETHPVLIEPDKTGLKLQLYSELPKDRPISARENLESNEFKKKDQFETSNGVKFQLSDNNLNHSINSSLSPIKKFNFQTSAKLSELNPLTSTSYTTFSPLLLNIDEKLQNFQNLKPITHQEEEMQYNILTQFFRLTNGSNWKKKRNWCNRNVPLRQWHGITTNPQGYIVSIDLKSNNLCGPFPDILSNFSHLETLFLDSNELEGELPDYLINQCPHLQSLSITSNKLYGIISFNLINKQNKLKELWLGQNNFYGIIQDGIGDLKCLTHLDLSSNQLSGDIPLTFGKLHNLIYLNLSNNKLTGGIPSSVASLSNLKYLYLNNNQLSGRVPFWILKKKKNNNMKYDEVDDYSLSNLTKVEFFGNSNLEIDEGYQA